MFFLLRTAFWLTLVLALIPIGIGQKSTSEESVDPVSAFLAAQATMSDIGGFCQRNQSACETGGTAISAIGSRARDGAQIVFEYLDTQLSEDSSSAPLVTGSTQSLTLDPSQHELTATPSWQADLQTVQNTKFGPIPRPKPRSGQNT